MTTLLGTALLATIFHVTRPAAAETTAASLERLQELRAQNEFEAALSMAEKLLLQAPANADLLLIKGQLQGFLGEHEAAMATLDTAAALAPDYLDIRLMQARVQLFADAPEAAFAILGP